MEKTIKEYTNQILGLLLDAHDNNLTLQWIKDKIEIDLYPEYLSKIKEISSIKAPVSDAVNDAVNDTERTETPYCPKCGACGEDGCCSAMMCKHEAGGHYCEWYLKELKFGYLMYKSLYDLVTGEEEKKKRDLFFDQNYDKTLKSNEDGK